MTLGVRTKIFLVILGLILVTIVAAGLLLELELRQTFVERIEAELGRHAAAVSEVVATTPTLDRIEDADPITDRFGRPIDARVTIITAAGRVIGDSELDARAVAELESHADRPEVIAALASGAGMAIRHSTTTNHDMLYVARRFERGPRIGVVRVSKPLAEVEDAISQLRQLLLIAGLAGLGIALLMSFVSAHFFSRTLRVLVDFAGRMARGEQRPQIDLTRRDELGGLAGSLNLLSEQLERHVSELAEERNRFGATLDGLTDAVLALDDEHRVTLINRAGILLLGLNREPVGRTLLETIRAPELQQLVAGEIADEVEFDLPGDRQRRILARATRPGSGGVVLALHDVTELRRLETVRRDFVSNVSHELRTPVSIIRANAETLLDGALDDREAAERFLRSLHGHAERLTNLIADLLDISRIEEGQYTLKVERLQVSVAMRRAAAELEGAAIEKQFSIQVEPAGELQVNADAGALDQVLFNLVENAVKYARRGGRVNLRARYEDDDRVRIEVEDDGPGVAPEHRGRLFERFYRVDPGRSREVGGTGLGLAIVKHLVQAMDGEVGMEPAATQGAVFWIRLPRAN